MGVNDRPSRDVISSSDMPTVFTIGYGGDDTASLCSRIKKLRVDFAVDIRSKPYSSVRPEYNRPVLDGVFRRAGFGYLFLGDALGGRPDNARCYSEAGKVLYDVLASTPSFLRGLERVEHGASRGYSIVLLCSEGKPEGCHRSKLVGRELSRRRNVQVMHVDPDGYVLSQDDVIDRIVGGQQSFGISDALTASVGTYHLDGRKK